MSWAAAEQLDVLTFGECMACIRSDVPGPLRHNAAMTLSCAGAEATVAIGLARLGHQVRWVGRVGDDELGTMVSESLRGAGVTTHSIVDPSRQTGLMIRSARIPATARVRYYRSGSAGAAIAASDVLPALVDHPRILHVTGITAAISRPALDAVEQMTRAARSDGSLVSYDINFRARLTSVGDAAAVLRALLPRIGVMFFGEDERHVVAAALRLTNDDLDEIRDALPHCEIVLKRGRDGAVAMTMSGRADIAGVATTAVDAVGAGDAFVAGYLSGVLDGLDIAGRLRRAAALGAFSVSSYGDWEGLPTRDELELIHASHGSADR